MGDHIELDVPARPEFLAMVRAIVTLIAETGSKLPSPRIDDLRLAVTEAFANAIDAESIAHRVTDRCRGFGVSRRARFDSLDVDEAAAGRELTEHSIDPREVEYGHAEVNRRRFTAVVTGVSLQAAGQVR